MLTRKLDRVEAVLAPETMRTAPEVVRLRARCTGQGYKKLMMWSGRHVIDLPIGDLGHSVRVSQGATSLLRDIFDIRQLCDKLWDRVRALYDHEGALVECNGRVRHPRIEHGEVVPRGRKKGKVGMGRGSLAPWGRP